MFLKMSFFTLKKCSQHSDVQVSCQIIHFDSLVFEYIRTCIYEFEKDVDIQGFCFPNLRLYIYERKLTNTHKRYARYQKHHMQANQTPA